MPDIALTENTVTTASLTVRESDLASATPLSPEDSFPAVFATSRLILLMEIACARAFYPFLAPGQLSVGVTVDMTHSAGTPTGSTVKATASYKGREGKLYCFEVVAEDEGGVVGRAIHKRAVVDRGRVEEGAKKRVAGKL